MTRSYLSLAMVFTLAAAPGCSKNQSDETQNPDEVGEGDGAGGAEGDTATKSSRARGATVTRSGGRHTKARKVTTTKPPRAEIDPQDDADEGVNGLYAEAYQLADASALPEDFEAVGEPVETFTVPNLDFDEVESSAGFPGSSGLTQDYALSLTGSLNVVEEAEYELCLHSDDGSQLLLEDMLVVDNDGVHEAPVEACELVYLAPGEYLLEVRYLQSSGPLLALHMAWAINGGEKVIVPPEVLFKPADERAGV